MSQVDYFNSLMAGLAADLELGTLPQHESGFVAIRLDDELTVTFFHDADTGRTGLYANVGSLGEEKPLDLLTLMLRVNLSYEDMRGAVIGLDPELEQAILTKLIHLTVLDWDGFKSAVTEFIEVARNWIGVIRDMQDGGRPDTGDLPFAPADQGIRV